MCKTCALYNVLWNIIDYGQCLTQKSPAMKAPLNSRLNAAGISDPSKTDCMIVPRYIRRNPSAVRKTALRKVVYNYKSRLS